MNKLREYQGVTYRDEVWWYEGVGYDSAIHLLHLADWGSDADHAALMDLKANPFEPTPTLESVVEGWFKDANKNWEFSKALLCARLRSAFPQIDGECRCHRHDDVDVSKKAPYIDMTAAEHIAALVAMGARLFPKAGPRYADGTATLILPPEMTND